MDMPDQLSSGIQIQEFKNNENNENENADA